MLVQRVVQCHAKEKKWLFTFLGAHFFIYFIFIAATDLDLYYVTST